MGKIRIHLEKGYDENFWCYRNVQLKKAVKYGHETVSPYDFPYIDLEGEPWELDFILPDWQKISHEKISHIQYVTTTRVKLDVSIYSFPVGIFYPKKNGGRKSQTESPHTVGIVCREGQYLVSTGCRHLKDHHSLWRYIVSDGDFDEDSGYGQR